MAQWDELAQASAASPFVRPAWLEPWVDAFGGELALVLEHRGDELVGVLPLVRTRFGVASPTNYHTAEFGLVAKDGDAREALARRALAAHRAAVRVHYLPADGPDLPVLERVARDLRHLPLERSRRRSPVLEPSGTWAEYEAALSKNLRGDVRRRRRRLEEAGAVTVEVATEADPAVLDEGFAIEGSGWKDEEGTAIRSQPETLRFYTELARRAAAHGWLRLCTLRLDGKAVAFHYNLEADDVLYHLKGGFDVEYDRFSPGKLLHYALVERAWEIGLRRYDFLGGDEPYKLQFASGAREYVLWESYGPSVVGYAGHAVAARVRPLVKRLRRRG